MMTKSTGSVISRDGQRAGSSAMRVSSTKRNSAYVQVRRRAGIVFVKYNFQQKNKVTKL